MSDFTGMFDDGSDLDARLEAASHLLKQAADEEGVDLNQFSEEELGSMIGNLADDDDDGDDGYEGKTASDITVADVSLELHKRAAYEDFDLTQLHPEEYSELFDKVAAELTDPYIAEENQKWAAQAMNMDELGRIAARGFVDEINKVAAEEERGHRRRGDDDDEDEIDVKVKKAAALLKEAKVKEFFQGAGRKAHEFVHGQMGPRRNIAEGTMGPREGLRQRLGRGAMNLWENESGNRATQHQRQNMGRNLMIGGAVAGTGGAAYGGKKLYDSRKKKSRR